ncbi:hypothetical protein ACFU6S_16915 [Streptomyces sp. NPDC057456]|uniref:hypothetical protein n=1 Tax=Streptomyces sp. NPDC057456 TaxID=3346139 RepID=UPI0036A76040
MSPSTAWDWAQRGTELWQQEGNPEGLATALAALPPLDDIKTRTARPAIPRAQQQTPKARPLPEDTDEAFTAWTVGRFGVDTEQLAELLDAVGAEDWTELEDAAVVDVDELTALLDDLPEMDPDA